MVDAWLSAFFAVWRGGSERDRTIVGHCPVLALDWDLIHADLPDARMLHVVRSPFAAYADTVRRRPTIGIDGYSMRWSLVNTVAAMHAARDPERFRIVRYESLLRRPEIEMAAVAGWLGVDFDESLLRPTWNGEPLEEMGPFGGVPVSSEAHELANVAAVPQEQRAAISAQTAAARALFAIADPAEDATPRENFTTAVDNLALARIGTKDVPVPLEFETQGDFFGLLDELDVALLVTREYEHFVELIGGNGGTPWQSALPLPHPSGAFVDPRDGSLVISSTRNPNQIFWFRPGVAQDWDREIVPVGLEPEDRTIYLPTRTRALPGSLYIHDVVIDGDDLLVAATGHNFVARIDPATGWERVWWPKTFDGMGDDAFRENHVQLNSIGLGPHGLVDAHLTAFADETTGTKPWKDGYGPEGRGIVFSAATRETVLRGLTCPHSATRHDGEVWLCNSGFGAVGFGQGVVAGDPTSTFVPVAKLPGFTRGLAFAGDHAIVGLSKVIERYEPYAPGLSPSESRCGLAIVDVRSGAIEALLWWPDGLQIYEVQVMPGVTRPTLPGFGPDGDEPFLRVLG